ncbi:MAG: MotE family protein [Rhodospirillales bacterium]|jgi:flagellar motility protein MotE (MotC chaperone)
MFKFFVKMRIVPVTIFAAALMLSFKVGDILNGIALPLNALSFSKVYAQAPTPGNLLEKEIVQPANAEPGSKPQAGVKAEVPSPPDDPNLFSQSEIDLLQQLSDRRKVIEARSEELTLREGMLNAAEKRINKKILEIKSLEITIQKLIKTHDKQEEAKMQSLVKIYEAMKPKDAARIFGELDMNTLLMVAERMKERKLAPVMASMGSEKAKEMTVELTKIRNLPDPGT